MIKIDADDEQAAFTLRVLLGLAAAGAALFFLNLISDLFNNVFLAYLIAIVAAPLLLWLRRRGVPGWLAFLLTVAAVISAVLLLLGFVASAAVELTASMPAYLEDIEDLQESILALSSAFGPFEGDAVSLLNLLDLGSVLEFIFGLISGALGTLSKGFVILLFALFLLVQVFTTPQLLRSEAASGNSYVRRIIQYNLDLHQYIVITTIIALVTGGLDTILFLILGIPNAVVWGAIAALFSFVPAVGFWLAAIPPTLLALLEYGPLTAAVTLAGILLINGFADNFVKPKYIGSGLDLAPFLVIFSVFFWAVILGPIGAIIGVPMTMLVRDLILAPDKNLSWLARVMGSGREAAEEVPDATEETAVSQNTADIE